MIEVLKKDYWSKSKAFLLPLTGLPKDTRYLEETYLFWEDYSIEDYHLILLFRWDNYDDFINYCRRKVFPVLGNTLIESFDGENITLLIVDMSGWARDVEMFLKGKYSKMSNSAKLMIENYHKYYNLGYKIAPEIISALEPLSRFRAYGDKTAIEYVSENYEIDLDELKKVGELADKYDREKETLRGIAVQST